ncbi:MAG: phosphoenolpyruvate carboxykinase domain-containing protein, partial [Alphaproteobacteria bacterium]|nr:phosphoenolpyruvate carboxykinase domain-containing protein [Alphaproteobacteria bacterium]
MAMLPFCGYNMADYWKHWLSLENKLSNAPKIFRVNWFRKDSEGNFIWPGFGENMRVLEWIVNRVNGRGFANDTPIGIMPKYEDFTWEGLDFSSESFSNIMTIDIKETMQEANSQELLFNNFGDRLPSELENQRQDLKARLME